MLKKTIAPLLGLLLLASAVMAESAVKFNLKDSDGRMQKLEDYLAEGPVLISFWASWCEPCKKEIPELIKIWNEYDEAGLTYLAIAVDTPRTKSKAVNYARAQKWEMPVLLDISGKIMKRYKGSNPPVTIIINQGGEIVYRHSGYSPGDEKHIAEVVAELFSVEEGEGTEKEE